MSYVYLLLSEILLPVKVHKDSQKKNITKLILAKLKIYFSLFKTLL